MEIPDNPRSNSLFDLIEQDAHFDALELLKGDNHFSEDELNKSLMSACRYGNKFLVQMLIGRGAEVNYRDTNGNTPLLISVQNGFTDIVQFLLTNKADVNASNSMGDSALILSIHSSGSTEIKDSLLKQTGINIDHQNQDGYTAIMKAVEVKDVDTVKILLDFQHKKFLASLHETVDEHERLEHLSDSVSSDLSKWTTLDKTVNSKGENVHQIAERCGLGKVLQLLQEHVDFKISPLELAMRANDVKSFQIFLDCEFIYTNKNKYLDDALKQIFQTCSKKEMIDFSDKEIVMIKALLEHGADVNITWQDSTRVLDPSPTFDREQAESYRSDKFSSSRRIKGSVRQMKPILIAAQIGHLKVLELLLSFKAEIKRFTFPNSPLHIALSHGHTECANLLLQNGAVIEVDQALKLAVDKQEPKYVRFLTENYEKEVIKQLKSFSENDLMTQSKRFPENDLMAQLKKFHQIEAIEHLKRFYENEKNDIFATSDNIFLRSVRKGNLEIIGLLLDLGAEINSARDSNSCPLAESANGEVAKFLIKRGASLKSVRGVKLEKCHSPLISVLTKRDCKDKSMVEIIQVLLENGASVNEKCGGGKTPLMLAAEKEGSMNMLQLLLDHGAELGEVDEKGNTVLIHAAREGCPKNVSFLLQAIKDNKELLNSQNGEGVTALMSASKLKNQVIITDLMNHGADVNIKDRKGNTALLHLLHSVNGSENEVEIIKSLIQAGSEVNWQNNDGASPLMMAAQKNLKDAMCVLLDSGAEINAVSKTGATITALTHLLYRPYEKKYFSCLEFLLDRGANSSYLAGVVCHKMITTGQVQIVPKLIKCGLGPISSVTKDWPFTQLVGDIMFSHVRRTVSHPTFRMHSYSLLCTALCNGNSALAHFFVGNLFLTHSDISLLGRNKSLRQHLKKNKYKECLDILNEMSTQPMSLFNLSFVAVSTAVGTSPHREIRVNQLPLPGAIKDRLLFKKQDVALAVPENDLSAVRMEMFTADVVRRSQKVSVFNSYSTTSSYYDGENEFQDYYEDYYEDNYERQPHNDYRNYHSYGMDSDSD